MSEREFLDNMNDLFGQMLGKPARFRGYSEGSIWYCWNTEPFSESEPQRWAAWKYQRNKAKGTWRKVGKQVYFASRKKAKARAYKWYHKKISNRKPEAKE